MKKHPLRKLYQEDHAKDCSEIEELRRICHEETERARQLRTDELFAQKERRTFYGESALVSDSRLARQQSSSETVPSQSSRIPSTGGMLSRDCGLPHQTRNSMVRTSTCWSRVGKTVRGSSNGAWMEKVPNWECLFVHRKQGFFLPVYVDDIINGWEEAEYGSHVEEMDDEC